MFALLCVQPIAHTLSFSPADSAPAAALLRHDYDPISDQVTYRVLDSKNSSLGQSFTIPRSASEMSGFRIKLQRIGNPPAISYRIGSRYGADNIASGKIDGGNINPFFEFFYGDDFSPKPCRQGEKYFIQLSLDGPATASGSYKVYGTTTEGENPVNKDYGFHTPDYAGGEALESAGEVNAKVDFAFEIFFGPIKAPRDSPEEQPRFAFVKELLRGPHTKVLREADIKPNADEFIIDGSWTIVSGVQKGEVEATALADFQHYLDISMQVKPALETVEQFNFKTYHKALIVGTKDRMPEFGTGLDRSESFHVEVGGDQVIVCGFDERGMMRGLIYLEDLMNLKQAPILNRLHETHSPRLTPRITCAPFYANTELDDADNPYTDEMLSRISHQGFNAIWIWGKIHDLGRSAIYPELGRESEIKLNRLNAIVQRAKKYGIDVYLYLSKDPLPAEFFDNHPNVRGNPRTLTWQGKGFLMCTSEPEAQLYLEQATGSIFNTSHDLKGIIFIIGNEGFNHDYMGPQTLCPRCANRTAVDVVSELIAIVDRGAKRAKPEADVVVWPYSIDRWQQGDPADLKLIERLPKDITFLANFETHDLVERDGIASSVYDYSISNLGPSGRFLKQAEALGKRGIRMWAKTEFNTSQEFIQTPCIPVPQRWAERFRRIEAIPQVSGAFMNWQHYGFMPSTCSEIAKWSTWTPQPEIKDLLRKIARRDFGDGTEEKAAAAWQHFSDAIAFYPFSELTSRRGPIQKGPAHPLYFDPEYRPLHSFARNFSNDLQWTQPFGPEITAKYLGLMEKEWAKGVGLLEEMAGLAQAKKKPNAIREVGVAKTILSCIRTSLNVIEFDQLRYQLMVAQDRNQKEKILRQMAEVAQREIENAEQALPYVKADSRLGYANSGKGEQMGVGRGGIFTPQSIEKKIVSLHRLLETDLPHYRAGLKSGNRSSAQVIP